MKAARPRTSELGPVQLGWLAGSVFIVSAGYGALLPVLPGWLMSVVPNASAAEVARHVGFLSSVYAAGVLLGAPLWGIVSDHLGRDRILIIGFVGYVTSSLLLLAPLIAVESGLAGLYVQRGATGFFVAAIVPVVAALVAEHTPPGKRARRFAWLGAMSLLGFLFGPALSAVANAVGPWVAGAPVSAALSAQVVLALSALLGGVMMAGLLTSLPAAPVHDAPAQAETTSPFLGHPVALLWLSATVMFVLAGFELGIVLQGQHQAGQSSRQAAIMLAECSLVMLGINALLFVTSLLEKIAARVLISAGLLFAVAGLAILAASQADAWMYIGVSLTSAGTGLVLPVIAYSAAKSSPRRLGVVMGALTAAAGLGQALGSAAGGWLFGVVDHLSYGLLALPLLVVLGLLLARPDQWSSPPTPSLIADSDATSMWRTERLGIKARQVGDAVIGMPEFHVAIFALLLNFAWEILQAPLYAGMADMPHAQATRACLQASVGDAVIMLLVYGVVAVAARCRSWIVAATRWQLALFIAVAVSITAVIEWLATHGHWIGSWSYMPTMPLVPGTRIGLVPLLQWVVVPLLTAWFVRRQLARRPETVAQEAIAS
ncbi:MFS transporter [Pseudorhodoferax sp. Leaf267]|jgi:MFS family permease|uniref:MFS transporter n=1 Tax=Pseudorhodoferax sp. Leaf267 TaxID=1736316 RepID=UPI0009EC8022|nr:MFS transporter [Pseudorhodoferax sp. Leaf267]